MKITKFDYIVKQSRLPGDFLLWSELIIRGYALF